MNAMTSSQTAPVALPRVAITYCTQCRWMLRAAYFGQELLSTFGTQIGEIALIPATGGLFTVELTYIPPNATNEGQDVEIKKALLWDRKAEGGFPETKVLKQRVRDFIDPTRDLGHSDKHGKKKQEEKPEDQGIPHESEQEQKVIGKGADVKRNPDGTVCEDCKCGLD
ncbi:Rdx family-domain-containing protein [Pyrenochaeta sp. MPI-SDFR-AT-0127]|nr:Rdx family-domain-containing protein [Pyrenochaeta sp. MPI-SDFR-AT-0127]